MRKYAGVMLLVGAAAISGGEQTALEQIAQSGRCVSLGVAPDARVAPLPAIAPGPPPATSFRFYEGKLHHRFGNAELLLDDAGH